MKLFNFKSFPFFCCFLGLTVPSRVYCAPEVNKSVRGKNTKNVGTAQKSEVVKKEEVKKKTISSSTSNVSAKNDNKAAGNVKKDDKKVEGNKKVEVKKEVEKKSEVKKSDVTTDKKENSVSSAKTSSSTRRTASNRQNERNRTAVNKNEAKKKSNVTTDKKESATPSKKVSKSSSELSEKKDNEAEKKVVVKNDEGKNLSEKEDNKVSDNKSTAAQKKEENKKVDNKNESKKNTVNSASTKEEEKKSEEKIEKSIDENKRGEGRRRGRRIRRGEVASKRSDAKDGDKGVGENKTAEEKKTRRSSRRNRVKKELKEDDGVDLEKKVNVEEEKFVGISSSEYLGKLTSLVDSYTGKTNFVSDIREKLSGKNLSIYNAAYQPYDLNGNQNIKKHDVQFKNQLVRRIDLKEKVNLPFFRANKEITKFLLDGVESGKLEAYFDPFLSQKMTRELLREQLLVPKDVEATVDNDNIQELFFDAHDVSVLEVNANWIFDKNTSDFSEDPYLIKLIIPADKFMDTTKIQRVVCYIRYVDVVKFLKNIPDAVWIDDQNEAVELTIGEAFSMKLYDSVITFIGNRDCSNGDVVDRFGSKEGDASYASRKAEDFKYKFEGSLDSI